jgi:DNA-binding PadR family transcriptional regulator
MPQKIPNPSTIEREVLRLLANNSGLYGLEMVKASNLLKRGTIYVTLNRMEDKGWVVSKPDDDPTYPGMARRRYFLSGDGRRIAAFVETAEAFFAAQPAGGVVQ